MPEEGQTSSLPMLGAIPCEYVNEPYISPKTR